MGKQADSVGFDVCSQPPDKQGNEARLVELAAEFFGYEPTYHNGFRHFTDDELPLGADGTPQYTPGAEKVPTLRTTAIFYDETPYL